MVVAIGKCTVSVCVCVCASLVPRPSNRGGKAWYTLFAHAFNLNVNITSILIVTFANELGLTDDVCVNTHESDQRAHNKHTTALSTVYKSLLVASP